MEGHRQVKETSMCTYLEETQDEIVPSVFQCKGVILYGHFEVIHSCTQINNRGTDMKQVVW